MVTLSPFSNFFETFKFPQLKLPTLKDQAVLKGGFSLPGASPCFLLYFLRQDLAITLFTLALSSAPLPQPPGSSGLRQLHLQLNSSHGVTWVFPTSSPLTCPRQKPSCCNPSIAHPAPPPLLPPVPFMVTLLEECLPAHSHSCLSLLILPWKLISWRLPLASLLLNLVGLSYSFHL